MVERCDVTIGIVEHQYSPDKSPWRIRGIRTVMCIELTWSKLIFIKIRFMACIFEVQRINRIQTKKCLVEPCTYPLKLVHD